jgi:hypothetical protein
MGPAEAVVTLTSEPAGQDSETAWPTQES